MTQEVMNEQLTMSERDELLEALSKMYLRVHDLVEKAGNKDARIELIVIVISAITAGTLWSLLAASFVHIAAWVGASLSTVLALLTAYQKAFKPKEVYEQLLSLYQEIGQAIADVRAAKDLDSYRVWKQLKNFQGSLTSLEWKIERRRGLPPTPQ